MRSRSRLESWQRARSRSRSRSWSRSNCLDWDSGTSCLNLLYNLPIQGRICIHFLEIICADIVFKFYRHTHMRVGRKAMTSKGGSKGAKRSHVATPSNAPENGTKSTYSSTLHEHTATFIYRCLIFVTCKARFRFSVTET